MKFLSALLIVLSALLTTNTSFAKELTPTGGPESLENIFPLNEKMTLPDFAERLTTPQPSGIHDKDYTCRAWTTCWDGRRIWCWARGYTCYSYVNPGYSVYCSATSRSGYTRYWYYYCY